MSTSKDYSVKELLGMRSVAAVSVSLSNDPSGEPVMSAGIDPVSLALAPLSEHLKVDIDPLDDAASRLVVLLRAVHHFGEISPGDRKAFGVFKHGSEGVVIFLPAAWNADNIVHDSLLGPVLQPQG